MKLYTFKHPAHLIRHRLLALLWLVLLLPACVSQSKYDDLMAEKLSLEKDRAILTGDNQTLSSQKEAVQAEKQQVEQRLSQTEKDLNAKLKSTSSQLEQTNEELTKQLALLNFKKKELEMTSGQLENASSQLAEKDQLLSKTKAELDAASEYVKRTHQLYDNLVGELKGELASNEIKIQQLEGGINLNLSDKILFPSGSAVLNEQGATVLKKVSQTLKENKYEVIVSGHTDNIPIRGSLTKQYPTNWELAAARSASVVRLLETNGVQSGLLSATSFGQNKPVAENDNETNRALNRRIEIQLKPIRAEAKPES